MAFMSSHGGAVDALSGLITLLADPEKTKAQLKEFNDAEQVSLKALAEVNEARDAFAAEKRSVDQRLKFIDSQMEEFRKEQIKYEANSANLAKAERAFEIVKSDFEALKTQTMSEHKALLDQITTKNGELAQVQKNLANSERSLKTVSLALDEREKALLARETEAKELIRTYEEKLAQLKSFSAKL